MATENHDDVKAVLNMTAGTIGRELLNSLLLEIRLLPDVWPKLSQKKQDDIIDRLRKRVETNVAMAVHLIASSGRTVVAGNLDQITIKDGVKAVVKFSSDAPNLHELYEASGKAVLVVVANPAHHTGGIEEIKGEADQRAMDLGHEYDPNGDGKGMEGYAVDEDGVIEEPLQIEMHPVESELVKAYRAGRQAAEEGKGRLDCPERGLLELKWIAGWISWHREHNTEWWRAHGDDRDDLGGEAA